MIALPKSPNTWAMLAVVALAALLVSLVLVVQGIAERGKLRRLATAEQARSLWQCGALPRAAMRANCRRQLTEARGPGSPAVDVRTALLANAR